MKKNNVDRQWYAYSDDPIHLNGSAYLGVTPRTLMRLVSDGKIGFTRLGQRTVFSREQLDAYIAASTFTPQR